MDEIQRNSSYQNKEVERINSFGSSTESKAQVSITTDENKFQYISKNSSSNTFYSKQEQLQISVNNTNDLQDSSNVQGKLSIVSSITPIEYEVETNTSFDQYNVTRNRCQTMDPRIANKHSVRTSIEKHTKRQSSFPSGRIDKINLDLNLNDEYEEDDSENENDEQDSDCSEDMQNIKEEQRDQIVKLEDDQQANKLKKQQTLKIDMGSMLSRQKSIGQTSEKKINKRKTSQTNVQYILSLENVDIKNPEHSEVFQQNLFNLQLGEYGNTYYIVLAGACFCMIPDPDYKSKERFFPEQFSKRKTYFLENPYTKIEDPSQKDKSVRILKRENSQISMKDTLDPAQKKIEKDQTQLLTECFPMLKQVHVFQSGESFGDIALITNDRRTATLVCKEDTHFLTLTKEGYEQMIGVYEARLLEEDINFLKEFSYFKHIVRSRLLQIRCWMKEQTLYKKSILYKEGEQSNAVYFIRSGEIEISQATEILSDLKEDQNNQPDKKENDRILELNSVKKKKINKMNTKRVSLAILGANQYFGQNEVLDNVPLRIQQAQCISQTAHVYILPKQRFTDMIRLNHSSMEKIKNEEKQKFKWKQERLQMISETRQQNIYKNMKSNESNSSNKEGQFLDVYTPSTSKSQNQLLAIPSQFGYQTPSNFNSEYDETRRHSQFGQEDSIKEATTPSQTKRMLYSQMRNKAHSTFSRCMDHFNTHTSTFSVEFDMINSRDQIIQKEEKQQSANTTQPESIKLCLPVQSPYLQSSKNTLQSILTQPQSMKLSYLQQMNNSVISSGKNSDLHQSPTQLTTQTIFQKNKLNNIFENINYEQKFNKSYDFRSQHNSPTNSYQKCQINPAFSRYNQSQAQQNNQTINSCNNVFILQNPQVTQSQMNNLQFISSSSFHENINSQNASHMEYLKMVHQSLATKKVILEKLQNSSQQNSSNNQNKGQIPTLGDASSCFQIILQDDPKVKYKNNLRINTQPNRNRNQSFSQTPTKLISKNQKNLNRFTTQENDNKQNSMPTSPKSSTVQQNLNLLEQSKQLKHSASVQINQSLPLIQNTQTIIQNNQDKPQNQTPIIRIFQHPVSQIPQRQKSKTFQENFNQQKNDLQKTITQQFTQVKQEEQNYIKTDNNSEKNTQSDFSQQTLLPTKVQTQSTQFMQEQIKQDDTLQYDTKDLTNAQQQKGDSGRQKFIQYQGHKYYLSGQLKNSNSLLTMKTMNSQQNDSGKTLPNIEKVKGDKSLDSTNIINKKFKSNSFSITNSLMISNISTPKKENRVSIITMEQQQQVKSRLSNSQDNCMLRQQNQINPGDNQNNKQSQMQINLTNNVKKFSEKKSTTLQTDIQNFMDFGKLGKSLKLDKVLRSNKDKNLLNKLVEQQQAKIQQMYVLKNNSNSNTIEKNKKQIQTQTLESSLLVQKQKKQNQLYEQAQNSS